MLAGSRAPRLLWKSGLGKLDLPSSFCLHLPAHNKVWLWRSCFIDRLPLSQGIQKGKRKNQKMRQALLGENTNKDKFPLSVSKEFCSSYLISFLWNIRRDFNIFLLRVLVSLTTLSLSLPLDFPKHTMCSPWWAKVKCFSLRSLFPLFNCSFNLL